MCRLLVVVDYQNDFVDGALGFLGAEKLANPIAEKIASYRDKGDEVVFTFDTHDENYLNTQEGRNLPVLHCVHGQNGHALYGVVADACLETDKTFCKPAFGSEELFDWMRERRIEADKYSESPWESIELVGLVSNICVVSNAILAKTACPEVPVIVDASCIASFDEKLNTAVLDVMEGLQIAIVNR